MELVDFQIGQNVTVRIPKEDRTSTDNRRLECVIVGKKKNKIPLYQLLCKHGTLDRWLTASELLPYACPVSIDSDVIDSGTAVTLRQAARLSSQSKELNYCKCKAHCKSMMCKCRKLSKLCSSRCHRGIGCQNKTEVSKLSLSSTAKHSSKKNILSTNKYINAVLTSKDSGSESETASSCQHMTSSECPDTSQIVTTSLKTSGKIPIIESMGPVPDKSRVDAQDPKYSHLPKQPKPTMLKQNMVDSSSNHPCSAPCSKDQQSSNNRSATHSDVRNNLHSATLKSAKDFHTATLTHQSSAPLKLQGLLLPHFGGQFSNTCKNNSDSATIMNLANTCPVDTWLMFLKTFSVEKPDAFKKFADKCGQANSSVSSLLQYVQSGHYTQGKCLIAALNRLKIINRTINLFESEYQVILRHIDILTHTQTSNCSSEHCKERSIVKSHHEIPSISTTTLIDRDNFSTQVADWLLGSWESTCGRKLDSANYPSNAFFYDEKKDEKSKKT